jgi:hypothetical protein
MKTKKTNICKRVREELRDVEGKMKIVWEMERMIPRICSNIDIEFKFSMKILEALLLMEMRMKVQPLIF